jgi:predicted RNA-binding protein YlxR (DUF448 family)
LRLALSGSPLQIEPDLERRLAGRGASIHPRRSCIVAAVKRGAFRRAWIGAMMTTVDELVARISQAYRRRIEKLLILAKRKDVVVLAVEGIRQSIHLRQVELLVVAEEAANGVSSGGERNVPLGSRLMVYGTEASLGRLFGCGATAIVALVDRAIAQELTRAAECLAALAEGA